jgi:hypothetical protein
MWRRTTIRMEDQDNGRVALVKGRTWCSPNGSSERGTVTGQIDLRMALPDGTRGRCRTRSVLVIERTLRSA